MHSMEDVIEIVLTAKKFTWKYTQCKNMLEDVLDVKK